MHVQEIDGSLIHHTHELLSAEIQVGELAVDATLGNGHDTLFLAQRVGVTGKVIGFDVQQEALNSTRQRLQEAGVPESSYELFCQSHSELDSRLSSEVAAVIFNLGYLPGADKSLITHEYTTLQALSQSMALLRPDGILSVMCYPGHSGGDSEAEAVTSWMKNRSDQGESVHQFKRAGVSERSPFLFVVRKSEASLPEAFQ